VRDHLLAHYPATDPSRLVVIPRGIDPAAFPEHAASGSRGARAHRRHASATRRAMVRCSCCPVAAPA
jgi:hypothetical protein